MRLIALIGKIKDGFYKTTKQKQPNKLMLSSWTIFKLK